MPLPRHEQHENLWRSVVPWCLRHAAGVLTADETLFLEDIISQVAITDPQRSTLTGIFSKVIEATGTRPWDA